ncbi:hypothetical protein HY496_00945 [Candidatus Woesearchaeota archaeon]|nr:hypothetical protein [Candidatus Woesearchaeota archaeon]
MATIGIKNIDELRLHVLPFERRYHSTGEFAVHPLVSCRYIFSDYDLKPKSPEEAKARGEKGFNGMMSSLPRISVYDGRGGHRVVTADIAPTRYLIGQAMRDYVKSIIGDPSNPYVLTDSDFKKLSPDMANVSLVAPVKVNGSYFLLSQIKGKALGSGEIHTGLVAGNVDAKYLSDDDPFVSALQNECSEEVGLDLSTLDRTAALYMVDERETGQVNFAYIARDVDINDVLHAYDQSTRQKLVVGEPLEVMALALVPFSAQIQKADNTLSTIKAYHPTANGLEEKMESSRGVRPYTMATLGYLGESTPFLLEKAGF